MHPCHVCYGWGYIIRFKKSMGLNYYLKDIWDCKHPGERKYQLIICPKCNGMGVV